MMTESVRGWTLVIGWLDGSKNKQMEPDGNSMARRTNLFTFEVARFCVTVLGVTPYLPLYVAVSPDCQHYSSDPFRFSSWFLIRFTSKSEILALVSIPFEMVSTIPKIVPS
eukprot:scaffold3002_cov64-Attheya_sp.AAC.7